MTNLVQNTGFYCIDLAATPEQLRSVGRTWNSWTGYRWPHPLRTLKTENNITSRNTNHECELQTTPHPLPRFCGGGKAPRVQPVKTLSNSLFNSFQLPFRDKKALAWSMRKSNWQNRDWKQLLMDTAQSFSKCPLIFHQELHNLYEVFRRFRRNFWLKNWLLKWPPQSCKCIFCLAVNSKHVKCLKIKILWNWMKKYKQIKYIQILILTLVYRS